MTSMSAVECICLVAFLVVVPPPCEGHGRLLLPASRSSMWRMGFNNPPNYQDNELWCGGYAVSKLTFFRSISIPNTHETLTQCCFYVGPT